MRKKGHKRINPNNRDYDRFFFPTIALKLKTLKQPTANKQSYVKSRQQKVLEAGSAREVHSPELATSHKKTSNVALQCAMKVMKAILIGLTGMKTSKKVMKL
ncbi:unnamed protein product [Ceratitis capitata]|uniref:(Mediterranean fruit fly) hypothetical protein n=1 Tax=Ceratitis capitata TaxID=7213 RepID=A0A811VDF9_CERCA|nr:unnamed protein product [Ceratitis capitata]